MCKDWHATLTSMANAELKWPEDLMYEIGAIHYFAVDFGISSSTDRTKADRIIGAFLSAAPPPTQIAELFTERCLEYANALRAGDQTQGLLRLGGIFAEHLGHKGDPLIAAIAATHFQNTFAFISEQTKKAMQDMTAAPLAPPLDSLDKDRTDGNVNINSLSVRLRDIAESHISNAARKFGYMDENQELELHCLVHHAFVVGIASYFQGNLKRYKPIVDEFFLTKPLPGEWKERYNQRYDEFASAIKSAKPEARWVAIGDLAIRHMEETITFNDFDSKMKLSVGLGYLYGEAVKMAKDELRKKLGDERNT